MKWILVVKWHYLGVRHYSFYTAESALHEYYCYRNTDSNVDMIRVIPPVGR